MLDRWMQRHHPDVPFERYAGDGLCHCRTQEQAEAVLAGLTQRFAEAQALADQQLAGLIMWIPMGTVYLLAALAVAAQMLRETDRTSQASA